MPKTSVADWDGTAPNNTDVGGINTAEGMMPSAVNNALREIMAQIADLFGTDVAFSAAQQGQFRANIGADLLGGFRNKIINGNFDFWQRGTSLAAAAGVTRYLADRFYTTSVGTTIAPSRQSFTLGQTDVPGEPTYFHRAVTVSSAGASNYARLDQIIEGVRTLAGKKATITFYAKADAARNIAIEVSQAFGTGGSPSAAVSTPLGLKALTTAWQKFSFTVDVPSIAGKTLGTSSDHLALIFWLDAGSTFATRASALGQQSGTFDIARVSIVEGDATGEADSFSPRHVQQELDLCMRYYELNNLREYACSYTTANALVQPRFAVPKRVNPTITITSGVGAFSVAGDISVYGFVSSTSPVDGTARYINSFTADAEF